MKLRALAAALCLTAVSQLSAHQIWIENTPEGALVLRFGEFGEEFEKSPGALDSFSLPAAFSLDAEAKAKSEPTERKADHFSLGKLSTKAPAFIETNSEVRGGGDKPARRSFFYSRWQPIDGGAGKPTLTFDLVPTGKPGEVQVAFRGTPRADVKVTAFVPGGEKKELTSDAKGLVQVPVDKPGFYLLVGAAQRETLNGFWNGKAFDTVSHSASITWRVSEKKP